jgi:DNA repair protein RecN (Recombination protein N)
MLTHIHIKDLAIVSALELELDHGMTVLTGETGAGKSILIDALGLALGERADNGMIRAGSERAEITAAFDITTLPDVATWLSEQALDAGPECILRRVLVRDGRSRAFVNDSPISLQALQGLGELLVDIHGQHAHQSLLHRGCQRDLLDAYAVHHPLTEETARLYREMHDTGTRLEQLRGAARDRAAQLDLLSYQVAELANLQLAAGELEDLDEEHARLGNMGQLQESCAQALSLLYDTEGSVQEQLARITGELGNISSLDSRLGSSLELLENALIQVEEATSDLRQYAEGLELNPQRLQQVEQRLGEIHDLARKYRVKPDELGVKLEQLRNELDELENADSHLVQLEALYIRLKADYHTQAKALGKSRRKHARRLEQSITEGIRSLGMPEGQFGVDIRPLAEGEESTHGMEQISFLVSANPGQPQQPLAKVASGGELSRISLAIQVATIRCGRIPTLIFDEVDTGIGGGTAEIVGQLLRRLGENRQVLCVTHLPQVAAQGHRHLQVQKQTDGKSTHTHVQSLDEDARVREIARMLGGIEITQQTLAHAREMVALSQQLKAG